MVKLNSEIFKCLVFGAELEFFLFSKKFSKAEILQILQKNFAYLEIKEEDGEFQFEACFKPQNALNLHKEICVFKKRLKNLAKRSGLVLQYVCDKKSLIFNGLQIHFNVTSKNINLEQVTNNFLSMVKINLPEFYVFPSEKARFQGLNRNCPTHLCVGGQNNRTAAIRHIKAQGEVERMEIRLASSLASPKKIMNLVMLAMQKKPSKTSLYPKIYGNSWQEEGLVKIL